AVEPHRLGHVAVEPSSGGLADGVGQHGPQLYAVEHRGVLRGDVGVADAGTGGHEVDLPGTHDSVVVTGVVVGHVSLEQPADGLQTGVRVRGDVHTAGGRDVVGTVVVDEAPGADERAPALRQGPLDGHRPGPAERYVAGGDDLHGGAAGLGPVWGAAGLTLDLRRVDLDVAHRLTSFIPASASATACSNSSCRVAIGRPRARLSARSTSVTGSRSSSMRARFQRTR